MLVSLIIPIRNEDKFIGKCLDSFLTQIKGRNDIEILCMDGMSTDKTAEIVQKYALSDSRIRLMQNPSKITPVALNIGIKQSKAEFIMIIGCHATYESDYIDSCLEVIQRTGADHAGGYLETIPSNDTPVGRAIAAATSSRFGVGPGARVPGIEKEAVQAGFGIFRRDVYDRFGFYDERLVRNQDLELCCRIHKMGGKTIVSPAIRMKYFNRSTFAGIRNQSFMNGLWIPYTCWIVKGGVRLKHFIPLCFVLSILLIGLSTFLWHSLWLLLICEVLLYVVSAGVLASIISKKTHASGALVFLTFFQLHFAYGVGSLWGILTVLFKFGLNPKPKAGKPLEYERE